VTEKKLWVSMAGTTFTEQIRFRVFDGAEDFLLCTTLNVLLFLLPPIAKFSGSYAPAKIDAIL
jgi:hypothetical protein